MRIRRLELIGFKSFPFSTTIDFSEGITAIVGPNGCGKSNILDALMWVMGATSPKLLRSRSMEDVIFSGAEGVAPLGRAEVRLLLDNSKKLACEPYRELPEIEIRRVVYRTGESEFWLNKHRCRLRDITEFFLGTGLGTNSYAIIEQGKVDTVIHAKPEERRLLFDESAGISKYKERREISIRKMEATKQNLARVEDILYEVNRQTNRLKRQAAKARRYQRLKDRLDKLLVLKAISQLKKLKERHRVLLEDLETLVQQTEGKEAVWEAAEAKTGEAQTRLLEKEESLRSLNEAYAQLRERLGEKKQALFSLQEQQGRLEETLKGLMEATKEAAMRCESFRVQQAEIEKEIRRMREEVHRKEKELAARIAALQAEKKRLDAAESDFEAHKQAAFKAMAAEVEAKNKAIQLSERLEEMKRGIQARERDLEEVLKRLSLLGDDEARSQEAWEALTGDLEKKRGERDRLGAALKGAEEKEASLREQLLTVEKRLSEARSSLASLLEIQERMEDVSSKGTKVLIGEYLARQRDGAFPSSYKLVADMIEIDPKYDRALEAILRDELEFVLVDTHETALRSLSFLKEKNAGRSGLIPRDYLTECGELSGSTEREDVTPLLAYVRAPEEEKKVLACLLKNVWVVDSPLKAAEIQKRNGFSGVLVTLEGDIFFPNGVIVGGSEEKASGGRVARKRKIGELKKRIKALEGEQRKLTEALKAAVKETLAFREALAEMDEEIHRVEMDLISLRKDVEEGQRNREWLNKRVTLLRMELEEMRQAVEAIEIQREEARVSHERFRNRQEALREKIHLYEAEIQALKKVVEEKSQEANRARVEEAKVREKLQGLLEKRPLIEEDLRGLEEGIAQKEKRAEEISERLEVISQEMASLRDEIRKAEEDLESLQKTIREEDLNLRREKEAILSLEKEKSKLFRELQTLKDRVSGKQLEMSQVEMEITTLIREVKERFQVDLRESPPESFVGGGEVPDEAEIAELQEKIARIGEINFVAVQEFEALKERLVFLEQQRADLLDAIQTLTETIQRINRTTSIRFKETYEKIQKHFSELFVKLFGGGKAELRLTDPNNYRETGVEIFAQPPGKRLQAIRLLSGGEKALVAIAFLFALFLVRPSPFCVLDEVDAPLDDANIGRFNQLIGELSKFAQFILITHNKHTMASATSLLGVTMEQPGVSKIVSVSLGDLPS